ncbi:MAG TPA: dihydrolipoyl dehydrogenase [Rhabdochlamydiaceae bacterium]|nr:dihydrolipoyl dehydrogenase [Rhabdochlamydiaceae bacterium]
MAEKQYYDLIVIGAGTGGYVAAIKAAQLGKKVALVEKGDLGGTCLNVGCIPTKTMIAHAHVLEKVKHAADFGITVGSVSIDYAKMKERKDGVITKIRKGLEGLIRSNGITILRGTAEFTAPKELKVKGQESVIVQGENIIIASGSEPMDVKAFPCDIGQKIYNSTTILEMTTLPKTLAIIGGGYIGCEFASLYAELGVKVILLEALPMIVSLQGKAISDTLMAAFKKKGIDVQTGVMVEGIDKTAKGLSIRLKDKNPIEADAVLVSIGRKVVSQGLGLQNAGVVVSDRGVIPVNDKMETNVPGIYAVGDVTGKLMLAHVAAHQGIVAATNAAGGDAVMHYNAVPAVIFTSPEIAMVGMTEEEALEKGYAASAGKFPFQVLGKSIATMDTDGFAQVVIDKKTGQILGAQVVGYEAASLIGEMTLAIANELTAECVADTIHAHPTLPEAVHEATLMALGTPLHMPPRVGVKK